MSSKEHLTRHAGNDGEIQTTSTVSTDTTDQWRHRLLCYDQGVWFHLKKRPILEEKELYGINGKNTKLGQYDEDRVSYGVGFPRREKR